MSRQSAGRGRVGRKALSGMDLPRSGRRGMSVAAWTAVENPVFVQPSPDALSGAAALQAVETRMILIVGANLSLMEWAAVSLFRAGHLPVIGQWFWPLVSSDDSAANASFEEFGDPVAERLVGRCDAVLRVDGPAPDADALVGLARARGLRVYASLDEAIAG